MKKKFNGLSVLFILAMFLFFEGTQLMIASASTLTQNTYDTPHMSGSGKGDSGGGGSGLYNKAPSSSLSRNNPGLVDGQRNCACYNHGTFGPGWNPGERIEVIFDNYENIKGISLYLGCSQQHGEVASGSISYVNQNGALMYLGSFSNVGITNNNGYLE